MPKSKGRKRTVQRFDKGKKKVSVAKLEEIINGFAGHVNQNYVNTKEYSHYKSTTVRTLNTVEKMVQETSRETSINTDSIFTILQLLSQLLEIPEEEVASQFKMIYDSVVVVSSTGKVNGKVKVLEYNYEGGE